MTTQSPKISLVRLKQLIGEELQKVTEQVDHKSISDIVGVASKLLAAVEAFKEKAPPAAVNATTPHLAELERVLENMLSSPGSYVPRVKKEPKRVTLKATKSEGIVREAAGGDGKFELVNAGNWQHLEVGNRYSIKAGRDSSISVFEGWVDKNGNHTDETDPDLVDLLFTDVSDGFTWEAYWSGNKYCVGSGADGLRVEEID